MIRIRLVLLAIACTFGIWLAIAAVTLTPARAGEPLTTRQAAELLTASVVEMTTGGAQNCTASKIGPATFLTAAHCARALRDNYRVEHGYAYQYIKSITITVSEKDYQRTEDWAVLHATTVNEDLKTLSLGCTEDIYLGMPVAYAGFPGPVDFAFGVGHVASTKKMRNSNNGADFAIDVQAAPGASGSPIISLDTGSIIGVLVEGIYAQRAGAFLVGVESIRSLDLCEGAFEPEMLELDAGSPF